MLLLLDLGDLCGLKNSVNLRKSASKKVGVSPCVLKVRVRPRLKS